jgi:negative regulator of flagellin synthesis FlgM
MTNITNITGKYDQAFLNETADKQGVAPAASTTEAVETERSQDDRVSLSNASKDMQAAEDAVAATPDVREEKVSAIKQAVENGTYEVDPGKIADKMIGSIVNEMV